MVMVTGFELITASGEWGHGAAALDPELRRALRRVKLVGFDFDGVMTDNRVLVDEDGREAVICSRYDGHGISRLRDAGIAMCIISTELNTAVAMRARKLKLDVSHNVSDKVAALRKFADRQGVSLEECAFVGNDINDRAVLQAVGFPVIVADAHPSVLPFATHRLTRRGGYGAVREFCDLVADLHQLDTKDGAPAQAIVEGE